MISPRPQDADGFFTDQSQAKSDDSEWDETRRWVDELHQLNSSFTPQPASQPVGPLGMSRDSLNGTIQGNHFHPSNDHYDERPLPINIPLDTNLEEENESVKSQRWHHQENDDQTREESSEQRLPPPPPLVFEEEIPTRDEETPRASPRVSFSLSMFEFGIRTGKFRSSNNNRR